jgi:hypothetical protein
VTVAVPIALGDVRCIDPTYPKGQLRWRAPPAIDFDII